MKPVPQNPPQLNARQCDEAAILRGKYIQSGSIIDRRRLRSHLVNCALCKAIRAQLDAAGARIDTSQLWEDEQGVGY